MVKKTKEKKQPAKPEPVEETKVVAEEVEHSATVLSKMENDKKLKKQMKQMTAHVNQSYDLKQAVKAVTAL